MKKFLHKLAHKFFAIEKNPKRLASATCLGLFIGFCPFLGFQTPLIFLLGWAFSLPISVIFSVVYIVNNPFLTTIPLLIANYLTGYILFTYIIPGNWCLGNPSWFEWIQKKIAPCLERYTGITEICFWYFIVGGVVFAILLSVPFYPLLVRLYTNLAKKFNYENNSSK